MRNMFDFISKKMFWFETCLIWVKLTHILQKNTGKFSGTPYLILWFSHLTLGSTINIFLSISIFDMD